jgi:hypothetical protein
MTGEGSCSWEVLETGKAGRFAHCEREGSWPLGASVRKIVPFVSDLRETRRESICFSRIDDIDINSRLEAIFELTLIAAGVAGVIVGLT